MAFRGTLIFLISWSLAAVQPSTAAGGSGSAGDLTVPGQTVAGGRVAGDMVDRRDADEGKSGMSESSSSKAREAPGSSTAIATLGAGCFWCVEAVFQELDGVQKVESGYMGGHVRNPTYKDVCTGQTGHAEVCRLTYDPAVVSFAQILEVFFKTHDPTTLNRQGNDSGTQYRSAVFYHDEAQRVVAEEIRSSLDASRAYAAPLVTEITAATDYYPAEGYHQNYFTLNPTQGYCRFVIQPKVDKFRKVFKDRVKPAGTSADQ